MSAEARSQNISLFEYVRSAKDPSSNVVLFEDSASIIGMVIATASLSLTYSLKMPVFDAFGSIMIGTLLGGVSMMILKENICFLLGQTIPSQVKSEIIRDLEGLRVIRWFHKLKI